MPKSTKRFILSTEKVNSHGFRIITSGIELADFRANPVMYWMHIYPMGEKNTERLPIGFWDDIQVNGDVLSAVPNFDDNDGFAMTIYNKVEHGTLRAASCGIEPLELSSEPSDMVPGQTLPTYKKSSLKEASIVDRGSNTDAVTLRISADTLTLLRQLSENAKQETKNIANSNILDPNGDHSSLTLAIIENALKVKKIDRNTAGHLLSLGTDKAATDTIKQVIQNTPIDPDKLQGYYHPSILKISTKTFDEIKNRMPQINIDNMREHAPDLYRAKFFEGNGKMPVEINGKPF